MATLAVPVCLACAQSARARLGRHAPTCRHKSGALAGLRDDGPSSSGRAAPAEAHRPARRGSLRTLAYVQDSGEHYGRTGGSEDSLAGPSSRPLVLPPSQAAPAGALVQQAGGASLLQLVAAWDQLAARLPPQAGAGGNAEVILNALKLAVACSPSPSPSPAATAAAAGSIGGGVVAAAEGQQALGRPVARALSLASRLADLAAAGLPIDAESIAAGILAEVLLGAAHHQHHHHIGLAGVASRQHPAVSGSSGLSLQLIEDRVGPIVAQLVHDIQRARQLPARVELLDDAAASALRELCLSFYDVRATAVEIVSRLDMLCSPDDMPSYEQQVSALEALQMYAPMAHALGLTSVASQLEDRCFQILFPESYVRTAAWLRDEALANSDVLERCRCQLAAAVHAHPRFADLATGLQLHTRTKTLFSTLKKLLRLGNTEKGGRARAQLYDLMGMRAIVLPRQDLPQEEAEALAAQACYLVREAACGLWECVGGRSKDYIAAPKPNGYQSLHSTVRVRSETVSLSLDVDVDDAGLAAAAAGAELAAAGGASLSSSAATLELQIRTQAMHERAEMGGAAHAAYKGGLDAAQAQQLRAVTDAVLRRAAAAAAAAEAAGGSVGRLVAAVEGADEAAAATSAAAAAEGLFRHLDQNGDGRISLEELQFALQELGVQGAAAQSAAAAELLQLAASSLEEGSGSGSEEGGSDDGTIGFEAFMALQRKVGLLQAISAVDHHQAHLLQEQQQQHRSSQQQPPQQQQSWQPAGGGAGADGGSVPDSPAAAAAFAASLYPLSSSIDDGLFDGSLAGAAWRSGDDSDGDSDSGGGSGAVSGSGRFASGAVACRAASAVHGSSGQLSGRRLGWGWQRRQRVVAARAFVEASSSSSAASSCDSEDDSAAAAGPDLHLPSRIGSGARNSVVSLQDRRAGEGASSSSGSSSNGSNGNGSSASGPAATASSSGENGSSSSDGSTPEVLPLSRPQWQAPPPPTPEEMEAAAAAAAAAAAERAAAQDATRRREATAVWQASRAMQSILRMVSHPGPPPADAVWQLVPAPSNPHPVLNSVGQALPAVVAATAAAAASMPGTAAAAAGRVGLSTQVLRLPEHGPCVIGAVQDRDCDYVVEVPIVSGRHVRLEVQRTDEEGAGGSGSGSSRLVLLDLGSTNGTRINRSPIQPFREVHLRPGDTFSLADHDIAFEVQVVPPPPPTAGPGPASNSATASAAAVQLAAEPAPAGGAVAADLAAERATVAALPAVAAALRIAGALETAAAEQGLFPPGGAVYADLADRARQLMTAGNYGQAYALLLAGAMQRPWEGGLWAQLANTERQRARLGERGGSYGTARAFFGAAAACFAALTPAAAGGVLRAGAERAEGLARVFSSWAQLEMQLLNKGPARTLFRKAVAAAAAHPAGAAAGGLPRLLFTWAHKEWKGGEAGMAQQLCQEALEADPSNPYALTLLGNIKAEAGDVEEARRLFEAALAAHPNFATALQSFGRLEAASGSMAHARQLFHRALRREPSNAFVLQAWAVAEARRGNAEEARSLFQRCTEADPSCRAAWHAWGKLEDEAGSTDEARRLYLKVLHLKPQSVEALSALGCLERRAGDLAAAERHLAAALAADPRHVPSVHELALVKEAQGRTSEASQLKSKARRLNANRRASLKQVSASASASPQQAGQGKKAASKKAAAAGGRRRSAA